jgi:hypothetical protein
VSQMEGIAGHAVRAMYLYSAMADIVAEQGAPEYFRALERLWDSTVNRNMYVTGGIGSSEANEGFTRDYDLPNDTAYCETCASVGMVLWNHRMFLLTGHGKYADVVERCMYNGSAAGVSLAGDTFFYANPMESDGSRHRKPWFDCSCCPTQIARFIPAVGGYVYAASDDTLWVNLYVQGDATVTVAGRSVRVEQRMGQPLDGPVTPSSVLPWSLRVDPERPASFTLALRVPAWSPTVSASVNGKALPATRADSSGHLWIARTWQAGDVVEVTLGHDVLREHADPRVTANAGTVALRRGPLIYCFEECDNAGIRQLHVSPRARFAVRPAAGLPEGTRAIDVLNPDGSRFTAVPYYAWDNRAAGAMRVWAPETESTADYRGRGGTA